MNRPSDDYYSGLESRLRSLDVSLRSSLGDQNFAQVEEFLDHAEYGVALLVMAEVLVEADALIPDADRLEIVDLAITMGVSDELPVGLNVDPRAVE